MKAIDMTGMKFGRLTVLCLAEKAKHRHAIWNCRCECGQQISILRSSLVTGRTTSCGCFRREKVTKHKDSFSVEYKTWVGMRARCGNKNHAAWKDYGGRGIKICDRWLNSYENFLLDMGRKLGPKYSIDRIDNDGNYEPGNCRWATAKQQVANRRRVAK